MADGPFTPDEHFRREVPRARRLFFLLLPFTLLAIALSWGLSSGLVSGAGIISAAEEVINSALGLFGGTTQ